MKLCKHCGLTRPLTDFQVKRSTRDGRAAICRPCDSVRRIALRIAAGTRRPDPPTGHKYCGGCDQTKPLADFYVRQSGNYAGHRHAHCIPCVKAANLARARGRGVAPRKAADPHMVLRNKLKRFRLTVDQYFALLDQQGRRCPGCGTAFDASKTRFAVDHDHTCCPGDESCGRCVRGLLCPPCNWAVGAARDDPQTLRNLATYVAGHVSSQLSGS